MIPASEAKLLVLRSREADLVEIDMRIKVAARAGKSSVTIIYDLTDGDKRTIRSYGYTVTDAEHGATTISW